MNWESSEAQKKYLLGELGEAERQEFECALLAAPEQAELLELAEQELIDDYLHAALTPQERAHFTDYFLAAPARKRQLLTAQALVQYASTSTAQPVARPAQRRAGGSWRQLFASLFGAGGTWKLALACTLFVALGAVLAYWLFVKQRLRTSELAHQMTPTPLASPSAAPTTAPVASPGVLVSSSPRPASSPPLPGDEVIAMDIRSRRSSDPADSLIREKRAEAVGLLESKLVYLEASGEQRLRLQVSAKLRQRLQSGARFRFTAQPEEADSALKITVAPLPAERLALTARIVDADGKVIWPLTPGLSGRRYEGPAEKVLERLRQELLSDVRRLEQRQK